MRLRMRVRMRMINVNNDCVIMDGVYTGSGVAFCGVYTIFALHSRCMALGIQNLIIEAFWHQFCLIPGSG